MSNTDIAATSNLMTGLIIEPERRLTSTRVPQTLVELLRRTRTSDKSHTHVLLGAPYGNYAIGSHMGLFWKLYERDRLAGRAMYIAEKPGKELPVLVDVDIKVRKDTLEASILNQTHLYTQDHVETIVRTYQTVIKENCRDVPDSALVCVLLEKDKYEQEINGCTYVKNGFHLHFPKLFLDARVQQIYIIPIVKEKLHNLFESVNCRDFIDANSVSVHWLLCGCQKPNNYPYVATKCFLSDCEETDFETALGDYILSHYADDSDDGISCEGRVLEYLPRILSINLYGREQDYYYRPQQSVNTPILDVYADRKRQRRTYEQKTIVDNLTEAQTLVQLLSSSRADDRSDWLTIGFCLWNITEGDEDGLSAWLMFSEQSEKFDEVECIHIWNSMHKNHYTIGTLKYFAKLDNPEEYAALFTKKRKTIVRLAVTGSHNDIAKILYNEYGNEFVCSSVDSKTWYRFKDHIWKLVEKGSDLRERISSQTAIVLSQFTELSDQTKLELRDEQEADNRDDLKKFLKSLDAVIRNCKSCPFKSNVMTECCEVFRNETFTQLLNKDRYLVAFKNGVYDFRTDQFRPGKPEDYLSQALPVDYTDYGSLDHPKIMEITDYFRKVFPDTEVRDYFLDQICQVFIGGNPDKVILMWTGDGNNGKTVTQTLFEKLLGPLAVKFSTTLITGKRAQIGAAAPELARAGDGVRWAVMDEPNQDELISSGILKGLTGNDSYWARDLFEKGKATKEIVPMFKIHMICNKLPGIRDADAATWSRIRVIPFESKFIPQIECSDNYEEQVAQKKFPMDKHLTDKMQHMLEPLASFLINRWRHYNKLERVEPAKVQVATKLYKQGNDVYQQFADNNVVDKADCALPFNKVFIYFKDWFREECPNQQMPNRTAVKQRFVQIWGELASGNQWDGLEYRNGAGSGTKSVAATPQTVQPVHALTDVNPLLFDQ